MVLKGSVNFGPRGSTALGFGGHAHRAFPAAIVSANYQGDLSYIKDNEPKYLDFEKFKAMDEFLKTSENS